MFALRRFCILVLLSFVVFVGFRCHAHHQAVSRIITIGGHVTFEAPQSSIAAWLFEKAGTSYPGYCCAARVKLTESTVTAADIRLIDAGLNLDSIDLEDCSPEALEALTESRSCKTVLLNGASFGDESIRVLARSPSLEELMLLFTNVTDPGLLELKKYPQLKFLLVYECESLTVAGASRLLPRLQIEFNKNNLNQISTGIGGGMF